VEDLRYPIGRFVAAFPYTPGQIERHISLLEHFPTRLRQVTAGLTDNQLDTPYREGGWSVRQVVHHLADSHVHAYVRTKWIITEDTPVIKAYLEKAWAETSETAAGIELSLQLLQALHAKWVALLRALPPAAFERQLLHPESKKHIRLDTLAATYAWHGEHHAMHIQRLKERMRW
jgi:hypothetical protein